MHPHAARGPAAGRGKAFRGLCLIQLRRVWDSTCAVSRPGPACSRASCSSARLQGRSARRAKLCDPKEKHTKVKAYALLHVETSKTTCPEGDRVRGEIPRSATNPCPSPSLSACVGMHEVSPAGRNDILESICDFHLGLCVPRRSCPARPRQARSPPPPKLPRAIDLGTGYTAARTGRDDSEATAVELQEGHHEEQGQWPRGRAAQHPRPASRWLGIAPREAPNHFR